MEATSQSVSMQQIQEWIWVGYVTSVVERSQWLNGSRVGTRGMLLSGRETENGGSNFTVGIRVPHSIVGTGGWMPPQW